VERRCYFVHEPELIGGHKQIEDRRMAWGACGAGLGVCWEILWVLGLFLVGLFGFSFCGLALVVHVYTPGVLRGALRFL